MTLRFIRPVAMIAALMISPSVFAHAHLQQQQPAADSQVSAPSQITLNFSEGVEPGFSGVAVTGTGKKPVEVGTVSVAKDNDRQLVAPLAAPLASGQYQVQWHVVSVDGHKTQGSYHFSVK